LISADLFSRSLDVKDERVAGRLYMEKGMVSLPRAAAVEAVKADIQASGVVDGIEALRAVFSIHGLGWGRRLEEGKVDMLAGRRHGGGVLLWELAGVFCCLRLKSGCGELQACAWKVAVAQAGLTWKAKFSEYGRQP
jgi:hypothetical protein